MFGKQKAAGSAQLTESQLWKDRMGGNVHIFQTATESPHAQLITEMTHDDYVRGWMTKPTKVCEEDIRTKVMARRIAVEQYREYETATDGWRLRLVDDHSECQVNAPTTEYQSVVNHDLNSAKWAVKVAMCASGADDVALWKADVKSAYRRLAVRPQDQCLTAVTWQCGGNAYTSTHRAVPFGAKASVLAWHR